MVTTSTTFENTSTNSMSTGTTTTNNNNTYNNDNTTNIIICSVNDYERLAKMKLSKALYEYVSSGSDDEQTVHENCLAYKRWYLQPRCLVRSVLDLSTQTSLVFMKPAAADSSTSTSTSTSSSTSTSTTNYNDNYNERVRNHQVFTMPIFISPAGVHGLVDPIHGECATAQACANTGIMFGLSQHSTRTIEEISQIVPKSLSLSTTKATEATTPGTGTSTSNYCSLERPLFIWWYQAYILKDRSITIDLIERAVSNGCSGIFITVDSVRFGYREADVRNTFDSLPEPHRLVNYDKYNTSTNTSTTVPNHQERDNNNNNYNNNNNKHRQNSKSLEETYNSKEYTSWDQNSELLFDQTVTWDDIRWIKENTSCKDVPLIIKGIMTPEDAIAAIVHGGADGIMVSNHGGRQLDGSMPTIDALPAIVHAIRTLQKNCTTTCLDGIRYNTIPILLDGGIRRGTDIVKALALGATAVGIGKPLFYGLACNGQAGVEHIIHMLHTELQSAMALTGCCTIHDIDSSIVTRNPYYLSSFL